MTNPRGSRDDPGESTSHYRLVGLLDLVKKIDVGDLFQLSLVLSKHQTLTLHLMAGGVPATHHQTTMHDKGTRDILAKYLFGVKKACEDADLPVTSSMVSKLVETVQTEAFDIEALEDRYTQIHAVMRNELSLRVCLIVDPSRVHFFQEPLDGWGDVLAKFPSCAVDIEEASKCLALNRSTACVFHSMRVVEAGLEALAKALGIPYEYKNWDPVLKQLAHIAETEYQKLEDRWKGQRQKFLDARERLTAIKDALRNPTMHVRGTFTEEMAEDVYRSARGFMNHLAAWV